MTEDGGPGIGNNDITNFLVVILSEVGFDIGLRSITRRISHSDLATYANFEIPRVTMNMP